MNNFNNVSSETLYSNLTRPTIDLLIDRINDAKQFRKTYEEDAKTSFEKYSSSEKLKQTNPKTNFYKTVIDVQSSAIVRYLPTIKISPKENIKQLEIMQLAANLLQTSFNSILSLNETREVYRNFKLDFLISGQGVLWCDIVAKDKTPSTIDFSKKEIEVDFIIKNLRFDEFLCSPSRANISWVARKHWFNAIEFKNTFGKFYDGINFSKNNLYDLQKSCGGLAEIYEIWDKPSGKIYFINLDCKEILKEEEPLVNFKNFFPTPFPFLMVKSLTNLPAIPSKSYEKILTSLNLLDLRRQRILDSLRLRGIFNNRYFKILEEAIEEPFGLIGTDLPDDKAGDPNKNINNIVQYFPLDNQSQFIEILTQCEKILNDNLQQITSVNEVMRDVPVDETATMTLRRGRLGTLRIQEIQDRVLDYLKSFYNIVLSAICEYGDMSFFFKATSPATINPKNVINDIIGIFRDWGLTVFNVSTDDIFDIFDFREEENGEGNAQLIMAQAEMQKAQAEMIVAQARIKEVEVKEKELLLKSEELKIKEKSIANDEIKIRLDADRNLSDAEMEKNKAIISSAQFDIKNENERLNLADKIRKTDIEEQRELAKIERDKKEIVRKDFEVEMKELKKIMEGAKK